MEKSESISTLAPALVEAQKIIEGAAKNGENPHFRSRYADLSAVMEACKSALNINGIAIVQTPEAGEPGSLILRTTLVHKSGEWIGGTMRMPLPKNDPQGYGSALTYARRYALAAMVGVCAEDDDGESACGRGTQQKSAPARQSANGNGAAHAAPQQQSSSAPPETDPLADNKTFIETLHAAFRARKFTKAAVERCTEAMLGGYGAEGLEDIPLDKRHSAIAGVTNGKADKYKTAPKEAAAK